MTMTLSGSGTGTVGVPNSGTAVSASGTSVDFTGIPAGIKRVTVMFQGISTSGTSGILVQLGAGSITSSGYASTGLTVNNASGTGGGSSTAGFIFNMTVAAEAASGIMTISTLGSNIWVENHIAKRSTSVCLIGGGDVTLGGALDRVRIATANGTDTFDAGSINILYE